MKSFLIMGFATAAIGFGFGVASASTAQSAADRIVESRAAQYCAAGVTELCR